MHRTLAQVGPTADGGAEDAGGVEDDRVQRHRVDELPLTDPFEHERLPNGVSEGVDQAQHQGEAIDMPEFERARDDQRAHRRCLNECQHPVIVSTSHACPVVCIQVPMSKTIWPKKQPR
jgi:hypothetical protein